jgi:aminobenzoyl-glutamate transport protein
MMFLYLIIGVIVLSAILALLGVSVTEEVAVPVPGQSIVNLYEDSAVPGYINPTQPYDEQFEVKTETIPIRSLLTTEGIRFIFTSLFQTSRLCRHRHHLHRLLGAGGRRSRAVERLIRKLVKVAPAGMLTFFIIFVGVLSSVASDAGYLILIPLAAVAFASVKRHPLVGLAAAFAGVACIFTVNLIPTPIDAMLTEITNESIALAGGQSMTIASNLYFSIGSSVLLAIVAAFARPGLTPASASIMSMALRQAVKRRTTKKNFHRKPSRAGCGLRCSAFWA